LDQAREMAEDITEVKVKVLRSGYWQVAALVDLEELETAAYELSDLQKEVFADAVAALVREQVREVLNLTEE
jgi:hypothetical protein